MRAPKVRPRGNRSADLSGLADSGAVTELAPVFATDEATALYYEQRAGEYDEWYRGEGLFAARERPGWDRAVEELVALVRGLPPARTVDVACGTGFLSGHLRGVVVGVDQSASMVGLARSCVTGRLVMVGDALKLAVADGSFDRVFTGHFFGHLPPAEQTVFLAEARRVAGQLVVVDSARRPGLPPEQWQERVLNDGSRHLVYKRYLTAAGLAEEIGGQVLLDSEWFVAALVSW